MMSRTVVLVAALALASCSGAPARTDQKPTEPGFSIGNRVLD